jgi:hypothetical protein
METQGGAEMKELWHWLTTGSYTAMLEDEVDRLREENRSLLNSLLVRAGVQPIDPPKPVPRMGSRPSRYQRQAQIEREFLRATTEADSLYNKAD